MGREIVVGLHFYQPPRRAFHPELSQISTDPQNKDWTSIIGNECYKPLAAEGVLEKASFDIYQTLLIQLEKLDPLTADLYKISMATNGIGEAFIHPILPDLTNEDKNIVVSAGVKRFFDITGTMPKYFWPPETAIDTSTLEVLSANGYQGFICAPEQIYQEDHQSSDNRPTLITLPSGRQIIALPFDRTISSRLAFDPKNNADYFTDTSIKPRANNLGADQTLIAWTDAETFGHHWHLADKFLTYLLDTSLPSVGLYPIPINELEFKRKKMPKGQIVERSAWSCPHGNLIRWGGQCDCGEGKDTSWKQPFYDSMRFLNESITKVVQRELGNNYGQVVSGDFFANYAFPDRVGDPYSSLVSSKISSLVARTSCATFFSHPEVSGKINLLYAYQSLLYLSESGLSKDVLKISTSFYEKLSRVKYPGSDESAFNVLNKMLQPR